ncbi:MAG: HD domain-containing protein [Patescibacteria group bacterium]
MGRFQEYLDPLPSLEDRVTEIFDELHIIEERRNAISALLAPLKLKCAVTHDHYEHSLRVAIVVRDIAKYLGLDQKALFYAGLLHDIGKIQTNIQTLGRTDGWSPADALEMTSHPMDGYRTLRGRFDFTAEVIVRHHQFQGNRYPEEPPPLLHEYSGATLATIMRYARILALADVYDAFHRVNSRDGIARILTGEEIKAGLLKANEDEHDLIERLYTAGILTTRILNT